MQDVIRQKFKQTIKEQIKEIEETIDAALLAYDSAKNDDNKDMIEKASAVINAELEKLESLVNPEIKLYTGQQ